MKTFRYVVGLAAFVLVGCNVPHQKQASDTNSSSKRPDLMLVALDRSGSTLPFRAAQLGQLDLLTTYAQVGQIPTEIWAYAKTCECVFGPRLPLGKDSPEYKALKQRYFAPSTTQGRASALDKDLGTDPSKLFEAIAADPHYAEAKRPLIVVLTDGDDDTGNLKAFVSAAAHLCNGHADLQLYVLDITPNNRTLWQRAFQKALGDHLQLAGIAEAESALSALFH